LVPSRIESADEAYTPLDGSDVLPILSWVCFLAALAARQLARLVPRDWRPYPWGVVTPIFVAAALAALGLLLALAARRWSARRRLAGPALAANGFVLALSALAALAAVWILRGHH